MIFEQQTEWHERKLMRKPWGRKFWAEGIADGKVMSYLSGNSSKVWLATVSRAGLRCLWPGWGVWSLSQVLREAVGGILIKRVIWHYWQIGQKVHLFFSVRCSFFFFFIKDHMVTSFERSWHSWSQCHFLSFYS